MKYNPDTHHRQTIRLQGYDYTSAGMYFITICTHHRECLFGDVVDGEMQLNALGQMVHARWQRLPFHFPNLHLDAFIVMPNHIHGILVLTDPSCRGAALGQDSENPTQNIHPNATPNPDRLSEPGVAFGRKPSNCTPNHLPNAAPLPSRSDGLSEPPRLVSGSVGAIVLNFKSVTTRLCNRMQRSPGYSLWQRNYYDHIVRDDSSLHRIRHYIHHNLLLWQQDQLHPAQTSCHD